MFGLQYVYIRTYFLGNFAAHDHLVIVGQLKLFFTKPLDLYVKYMCVSILINSATCE